LLPPVLKYQGYYYLSFDTGPEIPLLGWTVGVGRWSDPKSKSASTGRVELLLAPPGTPFSRYEVAGKHARFVFDRAGSLALHVASTRSPEVGLANETFTRGQRILVDSRTRVSFGKLEYLVEYVMGRDAYLRNLGIYFERFLLRERPPPDIAASPSPWDFTLENWLIRGTVGKGTFASVNAAKNRQSGAPVAAKFFVRDKKNQALIAGEVSLLKSLPHHVSSLPDIN
jgi:hypothetical protein